MSKTWINFVNPFSKKRQVGCLDNESGNVHTSDDKNFKISTLEKKNQDGGIGYFETRKEGKVVQKSGKFNG